MSSGVQVVVKRITSVQLEPSSAMKPAPASASRRSVPAARTRRSGQLQQWKDDPAVTPGDVAEWVRRESMANPAVLAEINLINEKLDTIAEARRSAGEERWAKLAERLTGEAGHAR